jgi:N-methylhydantoinase A
LALRYRGQSFELEIPAQGDVLTAFHQAHQARYGHSDEGRAVEIVSLRLRAIGVTEKPALAAANRCKAHQAKPARTAPVVLTGKLESLPVYERETLRPGAQLTAPSIVVEYGSTTLIPTGWQAAVDRWQNLVLTAPA